MLHELKSLVDSITIQSINDYVIDGYRFYFSQPTKLSIEERSGTNQGFVPLEQSLYQVYFCRRPVASVRDNRLFSLNAMIDFTNALSNSNAGEASWQAGGKIIRILEDGRLITEKDGLPLWVFPHQIRLCGQDNSIEIGKEVLIEIGKEFRYLFPGFYVALGEKLSIDGDENMFPLVRIYCNIQSTYSTILTQVLTTELNHSKIPFKFKIISDPYQYPRADAAVLYNSKKYLNMSKESLKNIYQKIVDGLNSPTPVFAKRLAPGISLAEDPGNDESFGQNRCRIMAEALRNCHSKGLVHFEAKRSAISAHFKANNIDITKPYLNRSLEDDYDELLHGVFNDQE